MCYAFWIVLLHNSCEIMLSNYFLTLVLQSSGHAWWYICPGISSGKLFYPTIFPCYIFVELGQSLSNFFNVQFAENYARKGTVRLKEIFTPGTLQVPKTHNQLKELESVHKVIAPKFFLDTISYLSVHSQYCHMFCQHSSGCKFLCSSTLYSSNAVNMDLKFWTLSTVS